MDKVYTQLLCVIAASYASSVEGSPNKRLFYTRTGNDKIFGPPVRKLAVVEDQQEFYHLSPKSNLIVDTHSHFPLYRRAWVL
ncbi:hypothetical protein OCU04_011858 [Sclerotinia nivalis]|uniref:Uncharacterized protein n=1 Tax=Sclerotinia nivalis TaxID=352851 RepID=A0A9X0A9S2_9HELO|nr:hypothetical protein OCU04_011858 [Sclerotinia nivalis]